MCVNQNEEHIWTAYAVDKVETGSLYPEKQAVYAFSLLCTTRVNSGPFKARKMTRQLARSNPGLT